MEEIKLDFINKNVKEIQIGTNLANRASLKQYKDIHCVTMDDKDLQDV